MKGLHPLRSHEDEPAWGHLVRAELVGGAWSYRDLILKGASDLAILSYLAGCDGTSVKEYASAHGEILMLRSMGKAGTLRGTERGRPLTPGGRGVRSDIPPRACRQCVNEDVAEHGYSWYRLKQNLPGLATCYLHGQQLFIAGTAAERQQFDASLGQLEIRAENPEEFAYIDDFVRRYEMALSMLVQRRHSISSWRLLVNVVASRLANLGLDKESEAIFFLVSEQSNRDWLAQTFIQEGQRGLVLRESLAEVLTKPTFSHHLSLAVASVFEDLVELSLAISSLGLGRRVKPFLRAANCRLRH